MNRRVYVGILFFWGIVITVVSCYRPRGQVKDNVGLLAQNKLAYTGFPVDYNPSTRQPACVEYTLTAEQVEATENTPKVSLKFMPDPNLNLPQATAEDYRGSGWSRGHMARRQDMKWSLQAVQESDYYTNICPQHEKLNTKLWKKIENLARRLATQYDSVRIVCGPIFTDTLNGYIGPNRIPVPDYFFKTLLVKDVSGYHAIAFLCPNSKNTHAMKESVCSVDEAESKSGLDFYSYLPNKTEAFVESQVSFHLLGEY